MRVGRTPLWPNYFEKSYPRLNLAILDGMRRLYVENKGRIQLYSLDDLMYHLFDKDLLVFTESITDKQAFPFLYECVHNPMYDVLASKEGHALAIKANFAGRTRWIVPATTWERALDATFIYSLRTLYNLFGMVKPTPGSLGEGVLRRSFFWHHLPKHTAPNVISCGFLHEHGHGGRCDVYHVGESFPILLELDMSDAYLAHFMQLPTGTSYWFIDGDTSPYVTYFVECTVTVKSILPLGPFPHRVGKKGQKIVYPTLPGKYRCYLWKEQIQDAQEAGCDVSIGRGIGWKYFTSDTVDFCRYMHTCRVAASKLGIERDVKKTTVSGLGHLGMNNTFYHLVGDDNGRDPCLINEQGDPLNYFVREYTDYSRPKMIHWFNYFIMQTARTLYRYALPYAVEDRLIMTNYDALLIVEKDERTRYAEKHSLESLMCAAGDLRWQELTNVTILGERSLECDQKIVTPGVSHELEQEELYEVYG